MPVALIAMNLSDREVMTRDLIGFLEAFFTKRAITRFTKDVVGRERPRLESAEEDGLGPRRIEELDEKDGNHRSFPSGHASGAFTFAAYLERAVARKVGLRGPARTVSFVTFYGLAGYIGYSRLRLDKHYFTDIVAGAALGTAVARYTYRHTHPGEFGDGGVSGHAPEKSRPWRITFYPPAPVPGGLVVTVGIRRGGPAR